MKSFSLIVDSLIFLLFVPGAVRADVHNAAGSAVVPADSGDSTHAPAPAFYDTTPTRKPKYILRYEQDSRSDYLRRLNEAYDLDLLIRDSRDDAAKALKILRWVHTRWNHNGLTQPTHGDALTILREAAEGKQFRCVEYATVATACLNAVGLKARTVALYTRDVEIAPLATGHVVTEVFLNGYERWAFLDPQWEVMPIMRGAPLNAVEFHDAIVKNEPDLKLAGDSGVDKAAYAKWILPYLFYLDVALDNSQTHAGTDLNARGKTRLMLVPLGAKEPRKFQIKFRIDNCFYTNSLKDFYEEPEDPQQRGW